MLLQSTFILSVENWMIVKNLGIFVLGILFGGVSISLFLAYYLHKSRLSRKLPRDVKFEEDTKEDVIYWNPTESFKDALDSCYSLFFWHVTDSECASIRKSETRSSILFVSVVASFFILLIVSVWLSQNIVVVPI